MARRAMEAGEIAAWGCLGFCVLVLGCAAVAYLRDPEALATAMTPSSQTYTMDIKLTLPQKALPR